MRLTYLGKETQGGNSPTLWETDDGHYVIQGFTLDAEARAVQPDRRWIRRTGLACRRNNPPAPCSFRPARLPIPTNGGRSQLHPATGRQAACGYRRRVGLLVVAQVLRYAGDRNWLRAALKQVEYAGGRQGVDDAVNAGEVGW